MFAQQQDAGTSLDTVNQTGAENTIYNINLFLSSQFLN